MNGFPVKNYLRFLIESCRKASMALIVSVASLAALLYFTYALGAVSDLSAEPKVFKVNTGDGFVNIVSRLEGDGLIRSAAAFKILSIVTGSVSKLKPGSYKLSSSMTSYRILNELILGSRREVAVTVPEGANSYDIDKILSGEGILEKGDFISVTLTRKLEGRLFPDTYKFFTGSDPEEVINKFLVNFELKTKSVLGINFRIEDLVLASILEKEVRGAEDQGLVAGILKKRLKARIPLQVDATICYIKVVLSPNRDTNCYPLSTLDFKIDSAYNTYLHRGLPPGPIGNPGISAIKSALSSVASPYFFYLSDPKSGKTRFAKTLEEQIENKARYLKN